MNEIEKLKESPNFFNWWKSNVEPFEWFSCNLCKYHFRCKEDLKKHKWIYHNEGTGDIFECVNCKKKFKKKNSYTIHIFNCVK